MESRKAFFTIFSVLIGLFFVRIEGFSLEGCNGESIKIGDELSVHFKNGEAVKGVLIDYDSSKVILKTGSIQWDWAWDQIECLELKSSNGNNDKDSDESSNEQDEVSLPANGPKTKLCMKDRSIVLGEKLKDTNQYVYIKTSSMGVLKIPWSKIFEEISPSEKCLSEQGETGGNGTIVVTPSPTINVGGNGRTRGYPDTDFSAWSRSWENIIAEWRSWGFVRGITGLVWLGCIVTVVVDIQAAGGPCVTGAIGSIFLWIVTGPIKAEMEALRDIGKRNGWMYCTPQRGCKVIGG